MNSENKSLVKYRIKLVALIAVFLLPFIGGWMALYVFDIKPQSMNYGELVVPIRKIDWPLIEIPGGQVFENGFGRKWTFILFIEGACGDLCQSNIFYMRQIKTLLGRDSARLQNVLVSSMPIDIKLGEFLLEYPNLVVVDNYLNQALIEQFQTPNADRVGATPRLFLVDPDQNFMMQYPAQNDQYRVLDDIKKLMKLSQIG